MVIQGKLTLKYDDDSYLMFTKGRNENISEYLNLLLLDDVYIRVEAMYEKNVLFEARGQLIKERIVPKYYTYHVCGSDLDSVLWNNVGNKLEIEIKNISKK